MRSAVAQLLVLLSLAPLSCGPAGATNRPGLGAILSRVDVPRLLGCASSLPDYGAAAKCLGAEAATQAVKIALDRAVALAEDAERATAPVGADDVTDAERDALAVQFDAALLDLGAAIDATHVPQ